MTELPPDELHTLQPLFKDFTLLEFGNKKNRTGTYREFYLANGCTSYTSIDWNGKDGALALDCNEPLHLPTTYDIVTNFGFSEHVSNQPAFWENNHEALKLGGIMCGVTPCPGDWPTHGILQPHIDFYWDLAAANDYWPEGIWINEARARRTVCYRMRKTSDRPFVMPEGWETTIIPTARPTDQALRNSGLA